MRVKWLSVPRRLCVAAVTVSVLAGWTGSLAAEAEAEGYDAEDCRRIGFVCLVLGEYEEGLKWCERGLAFKPKSLELNLYKVGCLTKLGRLEEAEETFFSLFELSPDDWAIHGVKAVALEEFFRREEALESYDRAAKLYDEGYPSFIDKFDAKIKNAFAFYLHVGRARALGFRSYEEYLEALERALAMPDGYLVKEGKREILLELGRWEELVECYDRDLELTPDDWHAHYKKGEILVVLGRLEEAVDTFDRAIEFYDDEDLALLKTAHRKKIRALKELGALEEALDTCDDALARYPEYPGFYFEKVEILEALGEYDEATRTLTRGAELGPVNPDSYAEQGIRNLLDEEYEKAIAYFDAALALEPNCYKALSGKGYALRSLGKHDEANLYWDRVSGIEQLERLERYDRELELTPDDWYTHYEKGETLVALGRLEEAVESFDRAIELYDDEALLFLSEAYEEKIKALKKLGRLEEAVGVYDEALTRVPEDEDLCCGQAEVLIELGRYEEAAASYEEAFISGRDYSFEELRDGAVEELYQFERYPEAIAYLNAAAKLKPKCAPLYYALAKAWRALGHDEIAASYSERGEELALEIERSYIKPGEECFARGEYEKAVTYFDAALALDPTQYEVLETKGWALTLLGKYDEALECLVLKPEYLDDEDHVCNVWRSAAINLLKLSEAEAALQCLDRGFELDTELTEVCLHRGVAYFMLDEYAQARRAFENDFAADRYEPYLLYLYLVDRADGRPGLERLRPLLESQDDTWAKDVGRFLADEMDAEDLLTAAGGSESLLCEAHFFIGYKNKLDGDAAAARRHFEAAVATGEKPYPEYALARRELRKLGAARE